VNIIALISCLAPFVTTTTLRQMARVIVAILAMTGRITMLGISRWTEKGGSYRTVQRFFSTVLPWPLLYWAFFRTHLYEPGDPYIMAGDECIVPKAGKHTHGLERFFSSLYGQPIPGLAFFALALINTRTRQSYPVQVEQMLKAECGKAASLSKRKQKQPKSALAQRPMGRPRGSQNRDKTRVTLTPELQLIQSMVQKQLLLLNGLFPVCYLVLDGHFGNRTALQMVRQCGLHIISKLRCDAALHFQYEGPQRKFGARRKYGDQVNYRDIPARYLRASETDQNIRTDYYQATMLHTAFAQALNVVILVKTHLKTGARAHVVLFSSDLTLAYDRLVDDYRLRFQIEFNFRDAKQHWGLDDFMNIKAMPVTNAANLALFMVDVAQRLLTDFRKQHPNAGVLDLKACFCGRKYVNATLELLPEKPEPVLLARIYDQIAALGSIHRAPAALNSP
jgi:putative transposase